MELGQKSYYIKMYSIVIGRYSILKQTIVLPINVPMCKCLSCYVMSSPLFLVLHNYSGLGENFDYTA